jgi:hypothetical protein
VGADAIAADRGDNHAIGVDHLRRLVIALLRAGRDRLAAASTASAAGMRCVGRVSANDIEPLRATQANAAKILHSETMSLLPILCSRRDPC